MAELKSDVILAEDENLVMELEAELWATSSNPVARAVGALLRLFFLILGYRKHGYLVITDKRVIEVIASKSCWVFNNEKVVKYVLPSSVKEVGYTKRGTFLGCFCQAYHFFYEAWTQRTCLLLKGVDEQGAKAVVDAFYTAISAKQ